MKSIHTRHCNQYHIQNPQSPVWAENILITTLSFPSLFPLKGFGGHHESALSRVSGRSPPYLRFHHRFSSSLALFFFLLRFSTAACLTLHPARGRHALRALFTARSRHAAASRSAAPRHLRLRTARPGGRVPAFPHSRHLRPHRLPGSRGR